MHVPHSIIGRLPALGLATLLALATAGCTKNPPTPGSTAGTGTPPTADVANAEARDYAQYTELMWSDEFDGSALDAGKWTPEVRDVWYNNELQATTASRDNVTLTGGSLNLIAKKEVYHGRDTRQTGASQQLN